jgi:hypothetical protein
MEKHNLGQLKDLNPNILTFVKLWEVYRGQFWGIGWMYKGK